MSARLSRVYVKTRRGGTWVVAAAAAALGIGTAASAQPSAGPTADADDRFRLDVAPFQLGAHAPTQPRQTDPIASGPAGSAVFARAGSEWLVVGTAVANAADDSVDWNLHAAYSRFVADRVELSLELAGWSLDQGDEQELGINPSVVFRWHWLERETWSAYVDAGIGVLVSTDAVPDMGTGFNFTPRLGLGLTRQLGTARLQAGIRWHHISNARIVGEERNPSRDAPLVYVAVMFPL